MKASRGFAHQNGDQNTLRKEAKTARTEVSLNALRKEAKRGMIRGMCENGVWKEAKT